MAPSTDPRPDTPDAEAVDPNPRPQKTRRAEGVSFKETFSALRIRPYRFLWASMIAGFVGIQMQMVARSYLAYQLGGTASAIAFMSLAFGLPMLFCSPIGGTIADRVDRKKMIMFLQALTGVLGLLLAILVQTGAINLTYLFITGLVQGVIFSFNAPARQALVPEVVGEEQFINAIALNQAGMNLTRIGGPSLAGALIAIPAVGLQGVFYLQAAANLIAFILLLFLQVPRKAEVISRASGSVLHEMREGVRYIATSHILRTLILMGMVPTLIGLSYQSFLPVFAQDVFGGGDSNPRGLGLMMTMSGIGAVVGSLAVAAMSSYPHRTRLQLIAGLGFGLSLAFFAVQSYFLLGLLALVFVGFMSDYFASINATITMTATDPRYYGRVQSVNMMGFALTPLGTVPIGLAADAIGHAAVGPVELIGVQVTTLGAGLLIAAFILGVTLLNPRYRGIGQDDLKRYAVASGEPTS